MEDYKTKLKKLCEVFLSEGNDYSELTKAINELNRLFYEVSGLNAEAEEVRKDIYLPTGKAIGAFWAAMCIKEHMRTKCFLRGVYKGIKAALKSFRPPVNILYAGTGPFAALAIPLIPLFTPQEIRFTMLEINPASIKLLHNVIAALQVEEYIDQVIQCDAAVYTHDKNKPVHMIITETMQNALQKEPQAAITLKLLPQLVDGGILIPRNIRIEAALLNPQKNMERITCTGEYKDKCFHVLGTIFELNKTTVHEKDGSFPAVEIDIPRNRDTGYSELCLLTNIQVFDDVWLTNWQCSLNLPKKIMLLDQMNSSVNKVSFQYVVNENPCFQFKVIS